MDTKWISFIMALGFLTIATTPMTGNSYISVIIGSLIVLFSFLQLRKSKKDK